MIKEVCRCNWLNNDELYIRYHDEEWGVPIHDDKMLFEMIVLESFHSGLSWYIILKKREAFRKAFDGFDTKKIIEYNESKILELLDNKDIVRHKGKILATIENAKGFIAIQEEFGSFDKYIWSFTNNKTKYIAKSSKEEFEKIALIIAKDLKKRGFKFFGAVTIEAYLEAIGVFHSHSKDCFLYKQ